MSWYSLADLSISAALGMAVASKKMGNANKQHIAVIGDGGIQMTIQELATISQYNLKVKILILNNNFLGMVRQWQELFFDNRYSLDLFEKYLLDENWCELEKILVSTQEERQNFIIKPTN